MNETESALSFWGFFLRIQTFNILDLEEHTMFKQAQFNIRKGYFKAFYLYGAQTVY